MSSDVGIYVYRIVPEPNSEIDEGWMIGDLMQSSEACGT